MPDTQAAQVALTADRVFWTPHGQSLWSASKDGSGTEMVYDDYVTSLVVEGDTACWLNSNGMGKSTFGRDGDVLFIAGRAAFGWEVRRRARSCGSTCPECAGAAVREGGGASQRRGRVGAR